MPVCLPDGSIAYPATADYKAVGTGQAAADFNAAVGRGWKFNDAEMGPYLAALDAEVERLRGMRRNAESLNKIRPPGGEIASRQAAEVMNRSGAMCQASIQSALNYLTAYVDHNHQVRDAYLRQDDAALDTLRGPGKDA
jgi:hypothetical protein